MVVVYLVAGAGYCAEVVYNRPFGCYVVFVGLLFAGGAGGVLCLDAIAGIDFNSVDYALYSCRLCGLIFRLCCGFVDCLVWYFWWLAWCCMILLCGFLYWLVVYLLRCLVIAGLSDLWCYCRFWLVALFVFSGWAASFAGVWFAWRVVCCFMFGFAIYCLLVVLVASFCGLVWLW